jgi:hypothetical protein
MSLAPNDPIIWMIRNIDILRHLQLPFLGKAAKRLVAETFEEYREKVLKNIF